MKLLLASALAAAGLAAALSSPAIRLVPPSAHPGGSVAIVGTGWTPGLVVTLHAGPPNSEADRFASVRADARGGFRKTTRLHSSAMPGKYVFIACQRQCRVRATATLTVLP